MKSLNQNWLYSELKEEFDDLVKRKITLCQNQSIGLKAFDPA